MGKRAAKVKWIVSDVLSFHPEQKYDLWHDRATFHFLTDEHEASAYIDTARQFIRPNGILIIGTFSEQGPEQCSGLTVKRYAESELTDRFNQNFRKEECFSEEHRTP